MNTSEIEVLRRPVESAQFAFIGVLAGGGAGPVALAQPDSQSRRAGFWAAGLGVFVFWNLATLVGALLGDVLGDPARWGLDGAAAAAFVALLWPRLKERDARAVGVAAAVVAATLVPIAPAGVPILAAGATAAAVAVWQHRRRGVIAA